jgi:outer membrane protein OmpA-like peptidoglycan-associated protein
VRACVVTAAISFVAAHVVLALWPAGPDALVVAEPPIEQSSTQLSDSPAASTAEARSPAGRTEPAAPAMPSAQSRTEPTPPTPERGSIHVYFRFDGEELSDAAKGTLRPLIRVLEREQALSVQLDGYTDPTGDPAYNVELSQRRVAAVRRYLAENRIAAPRIQSIGRGVLGDRTMSDSDKRRVTATLVRRPEGRIVTR